MSKRIVGIDVGGTFTDVVCYDHVTGGFQIAKLPTTSDDQSLGCVNALASLEDAGGGIQSIVHSNPLRSKRSE